MLVSCFSTSSVVFVDTIGPESSTTFPSSKTICRLTRVSICFVVVSSVFFFVTTSSVCGGGRQVGMEFVIISRSNEVIADDDDDQVRRAGKWECKFLFVRRSSKYCIRGGSKRIVFNLLWFKWCGSCTHKPQLIGVWVWRFIVSVFKSEWRPVFQSGMGIALLLTRFGVVKKVLIEIIGNKNVGIWH